VPEGGRGWPLARLVALAEGSPAGEVCGLLVRAPDGQVEAWPIDNASGSPVTGFELEPRELLEALRRLDAGGGQMVAVYHSHLAGGAGLSARDLAGALVDGAPLLGGVAQVVVAMEGGQATTVRVHRWSGLAYEPADLWSHLPPPPSG
jgi:proteasome lid subunit RPN8/RPN11